MQMMKVCMKFKFIPEPKPIKPFDKQAYIPPCAAIKIVTLPKFKFYPDHKPNGQFTCHKRVIQLKMNQENGYSCYFKSLMPEFFHTFVYNNITRESMPFFL